MVLRYDWASRINDIRQLAAIPESVDIDHFVLDDVVDVAGAGRRDQSLWHSAVLVLGEGGFGAGWFAQPSYAILLIARVIAVSL